MNPAMGWSWGIALAVAVLALAYLLQAAAWLRRNKKNSRLPPGPKPLPILGHFHLLGKLPHQDLHRLAKKHGPIMYLRFGFVPNIVVSSPEAAEQFLKTHDIVFAGRPPHEAAKYISYEQRSMSFAPYGPFWREMRKLCTLQLLSAHKIASFQSMRKEELDILIDKIKQAAQDSITVDLSASVASMSADMSCRMVFGKKYAEEEFHEKGFKAVIQEGMKLGAIPNIGDYYPYVGKLDLQGLTRRMKAVRKVFDGFLEKIIDEHVQAGGQGQNKDFVDILLAFMKSDQADFRIDRCHVKAVMLDMLAASMDTSATAIDWTLSELLRHPRVMNKVQDELQQVVGMERMVEETDLDKLEYLEMVVKEAFRLHPVAPLLLPHEATQDCIVNGYHIPRKARLTINIWAIGRDPNVWTDPEKFIPERFEGSTIDLRGRDFQLLPFGAGRRRCPGLQLGLLMVKLVVGQLVHCFKWELPDDMLPTDLDMSEDFGLVTTRTKHLLAIPAYRLSK
ncbi:cytochrome P450 71AU50-like isoform X1 [Diospyros lotus]|uniref:cytochrome P450 71AU50-like isoform X1 n=1 Tax=Diospyros lotus TaxID=55363 RepID=UPI00225A600D|nr:cytochrome P450 71AU50-like isoform X1 [Diospyros lotus]